MLDAERFLFETEKLVDQAELKRIIDEMKAAMLAEADRVAEEWGRNRVKEAVAKGSDRKARREAGQAGSCDNVKRANRVDGPAWDEREHEVLEADFVITLSDGTQVTVREICADPAEVRREALRRSDRGRRLWIVDGDDPRQRQGRAVDLQPRARRRPPTTRSWCAS